MSRGTFHVSAVKSPDAWVEIFLDLMRDYACMRATWRNVAHFPRKGKAKKRDLSKRATFWSSYGGLSAGVGEARLLTPLSYMYVAPCSCIASHSFPLIVNGNACRKAMSLDMYSGVRSNALVAETRVSFVQEQV